MPVIHGADNVYGNDDGTEVAEEPALLELRDFVTKCDGVPLNKSFKKTYIWSHVNAQHQTTAL